MATLSPDVVNQLQSYLSNLNNPEIFRQTAGQALLGTKLSQADATNVNDIMKFVSEYDLQLSPYQEKYLDNLLSQYNAQHDILNQAGQLQSLGLSSADVSPAGMGRAGQATYNTATAREQRKVQEASNRIGLAKAFLGLAGGLGAAGLYGYARNAVRKSASKLAAMSASSASSLKTGTRFTQEMYDLARDRSWLNNDDDF